MDILTIGDLHLGRRPAHASAVVDHLDDTDAISPRAAWDRCVDYAVELVGWSYTGERALSPLPALAAPGWPRLGLLHGDRDVADSPYAPVKSTTLAAANVDGWLLGHIHKPDALALLLARPKITHPLGARGGWPETPRARQIEAYSVHLTEMPNHTVRCSFNPFGRF